LKNKAIEGDAPECFANGLWKLVEKGEMDEEQAYYMAGGLLAAGTESVPTPPSPRPFRSMLKYIDLTSRPPRRLIQCYF
jgi:hypothetical protein